MIKDFYKNISGDYEDVLLRLPTDEFILRIVKRFSTDDTYSHLMEAAKAEDIQECFKTAHKLKGIAANLAFTKLYELSSEICEQTRALTNKADESLIEHLTENYNKIIEQIALL